MARPKLDTKNIVPTPDGKFRVDIVRTLPNGQRFRRNTVRSSQEEAIKFRDEALVEYERVKEGEQVTATNGYTLQEWCEYCLDSIMPNQANRRGKPYEPRTLDVYRTVLKTCVYKYIGTVKLTALNVTHLDSLMPKVNTAANRANVKKVLSRCLTLAEDRNLRPRGSNPCKAITLPNAKRQRTTGKVIVTKERQASTGRILNSKTTVVPDGLIVETVRVLSFDEETSLLAHVRQHPRLADYETIILLGLRAGLRIGEVLALDWSAVDFEAGTLTIDQQVQRQTGKGLVVKDVKSDAGNRVVPMTKSLSDHLRAVKLLSSSPHVVSNGKNGRREAVLVAKNIRVLVEDAGINDKVEGRRFVPRPTSHDFRRTCLTRLATGHVAPGVIVTPVPPTTLILISGHEDVETLLSFYTKGDASGVALAMASMP